jgi:hypothetical protein
MSNNAPGSERFESPPELAGVAIRFAGEAEESTLVRLAQLDSSEVPAPPVLIAEIEGLPLVAISLVTGELIADPFTRTVELRALLELRAAQLRRPDGKPRRRGARVPVNGSRPALAGSLERLADDRVPARGRLV